PFSKLVGRFLALRISYGAFIIINAACGFTHTQKQMMILRTFAGIFLAAPVSLGPIILGELWGAKYRGRPLALNSLAIVVGPAIGRVLGQALLDKINWRWIFWLTSMLFTVLGVSIIISGPKSLFSHFFRPMRLKTVEEKENSVKSSSRDIILSPNFSKSKTPKGFGILKTMYEGLLTYIFNQINSLYSTLRALIPCPLRIMFSDPLVFMLSVHMGLIYTLYYMTSEYAPDVYEEVFKQSPLLSSLHMCSMGIGSIFASKLNTDTLSKFCDTLRIKKSSLQKLPEYKFRCMFPGVIFLPLGTGLFSFSTQGSNLWIVADLGLFFFGAGIVLSFRKATTYIIDTFGSQAAAALSAINILRRFAAFFIPIFVILTKPHLKCKWAEFSGAIVSLTLICPMPIVFFLKGKNIRRFPVQAL
ncbi:major facilitator superfamily domain-containing protein, partial [Phakopsora pachyrhizi]